MAIKRYERYPSRYLDPTDEQPQGAFKDRTSPNANDGSYLQADWLNDFSGFFSALLNASGEVPNGVPDTATDSQYLRGMQSFIPKNIVEWEAKTVYSTASLSEEKWCKVAKLTPANGVFSGILSLTAEDTVVDNVSRSATLFVYDGFSKATSASRHDAYLVSVACSEFGSGMALRIVRYSNVEAYIEVKFNRIGPASALEMPTACHIHTLSGSVEPITTLDLSEITVPLPEDDLRIKAYTEILKKEIKINQDYVFHSGSYPSATTYQKGLVQLSDSWLPDSEERTKAATLKITRKLKEEIDVLKTKSFAIDAVYTNVSSQRAVNVDYTNNTGHLMLLNVHSYRGATTTMTKVLIDGVVIQESLVAGEGSWARTSAISAVVPAGSTYRIEGDFSPTVSRSGWFEYRSASARGVQALAKDQYYYSVDGKIFKAFDEKLTEEDVVKAGYTLSHLDYDAFEIENKKNIAIEEQINE